LKLKDSFEMQKLLGEERKKKPEEIVLEDIVVPFLMEDLGYQLIDPRFQRVPVRFGREIKYADTVVYIIKNSKKIPHILVETKAPCEVLDWEQAESYAQRLGAPYFLVTDGKTWLWYQTGDRQCDSRKIDNAPKPPAYTEKNVLVAFEDLSELQRIVGRCHDIIRNEEGFDPTISFDEMSKLLFAKMQDEKEVEQGFADNINRTPKNEYEYRINKDELPEDIGSRVKMLFERAKNKFPEIFEGTSEDIKYLKLRFPTIFHIVQILQVYTLEETAIDIKGATYEKFIKGTFAARGLGQFFTPREIVEFMVYMVEPKRKHKILDPAAGSAGFLVLCMEKVFEEIDSLYRQRGLDNPKQEKWKFATKHLYGIDLNERMTWVAKMNMVMHGDGHGGIFHHDGLKDSERIEPIIREKGKDGFDIILTNPPFGSKIKNQELLASYELGRGSKTQLTEVLFIERSLCLLKPGGILGIVVPDGVLSNVSLSEVRAYIRRNAIIKAIISVPLETFLPYGSNVKTSLLFLQKKDLHGELKQEKVFMAIAENIGYDATGRATGKNDLPKILEIYKNQEWKIL
jgi:type I restriction enzyme M protein